MKKLIFFICILFSASMGYAQNEICISYDAAGNRTKRKLCCTNCLPPPSGSIVADRNTLTGDSSQEKMVIAPNPNHGVFSINTVGIPLDAQVIILDMGGTVLVNRQLGNGQFDITSYPSGTYVISLTYSTTRKTALFEKTSK